MKKFILLLVLGLLFGCSEKIEKNINLNSNWETIVEKGRDTEVNFYMWSGDSQINKYVDKWLGEKMQETYGIKIKRIPIVDIKDTINKLALEKKANKKYGNIDIIWINGENFKTAKLNGLLWGDFTKNIPAVKKYIKEETLDFDFGEAIEGLEAPWGEAQFVFINDSEKTEEPPKSVEELKEWLVKNPGKFTYPAPPDFIGSAFVRHIVYEITGGPGQFMIDLDEEETSKKLKPVWDYLNEIEPYLWRKGETYPESQAKLNQLYSNGEVDITMAYHPLTAENKINEGLFPKTSKTYLLDRGTLFNNHYLSIPFNSENKAGAMLVIDFLLSPEAQAIKANPKYWGDGTVIDMRKLTKNQIKLFGEIKVGVSGISKEELDLKRVPELKAEYLEFIEKEWEKNVSRK